MSGRHIYLKRTFDKTIRFSEVTQASGYFLLNPFFYYLSTLSHNATGLASSHAVVIVPSKPDILCPTHMALRRFLPPVRSLPLSISRLFNLSSFLQVTAKSTGDRACSSKVCCRGQRCHRSPPVSRMGPPPPGKHTHTHMETHALALWCECLLCVISRGGEVESFAAKLLLYLTHTCAHARTCVWM